MFTASPLTLRAFDNLQRVRRILAFLPPGPSANPFARATPREAIDPMWGWA